jgi:hypothetical protein
MVGGWKKPTVRVVLSCILKQACMKGLLNEFKKFENGKFVSSAALIPYVPYRTARIVYDNTVY